VKDFEAVARIVLGEVFAPNSKTPLEIVTIALSKAHAEGRIEGLDKAREAYKEFKDCVDGKKRHGGDDFDEISCDDGVCYEVVDIFRKALGIEARASAGEGK
jgi:hypothetical protein